MWFLIKATFWFSLVLIVLPFFSSESRERLANDPQLQLSDAYSVFSGAYTYVSGLCDEKPDVCVKGAQTFVALGHRAREGARVAYELLDHQFGDPQDTANETDIAKRKQDNGLADVASAPETAKARARPRHSEATAPSEAQSDLMDEPASAEPEELAPAQAMSDATSSIRHKGGPQPYRKPHLNP